jgi:DNA-binding MarR family transcriptional regulator
MTTTPSPSLPPSLTGREIGQAQRAIGALLDRLLDAAGLPFDEWTILFTLDVGGPLSADAIVERQADGLKVSPAEARATLDRMVASGLLASVDGGDALAASDAGEAVFRPVRVAVAQLTTELYGDLPPADVEATRRTLAEVTRRANARLALPA